MIKMNRKRHQKLKNLQLIFGSFYPVKSVPGRNCPKGLIYKVSSFWVPNYSRWMLFVLKY